MSDNWSLKELYTSFTSKEFLEDLDKVDKSINDLKVFSENLTGESDNLKSLEDIINKLENNTLKNVLKSSSHKLPFYL